MPNPDEQNDIEARRQARLESRRDHTRNEILSAARKLLFKDGIAGVTLEAVASEVGMSKTALYYYFASKDALLFEMVFSVFARHAEGLEKAVDKAVDGPEALKAIVGQTVHEFADRLDDFRLSFLHGQLSAPGTVQVMGEQLERIRPLNDRFYAGATGKLASADIPNRAGLPPRMLAFLAHAAAIGILTFKGMVESVGDPLIYSDDQLADAMGAVFAAAAEPLETKTGES